MPCNTLVFTRLPAFAPSGDAIRLAIIMITAGISNTWPVIILPAVEPTAERNVMASEDAIVTRVGIFSTSSIIGTNKNAPAATTTPAAIPVTYAKNAASHLLNVTWSSGVSSTTFLGTNIITAAMVAITPYTKLMPPSVMNWEP